MSDTEAEAALPVAVRCAQTLVAGLIGGGVEHVVLAPGSRSAPLAYAALAAAAAGRIRLHVRLDERSAGFVALGLAKVSERPVAVVTTSGTAVANLHPAVLEAAASALPLVVLSADRPGAMAHTGANQTTEQHRLFGVHLRAAVHLEAGASGEDAWRFHVARVLALAAGTRTGLPGPVQLNVAFPEPLTANGMEQLWRAAPAAPETFLRPREPDPVRLPGSERTVVVAGDLPPERGRQIAAAAARARVPLLAEPSSNARRGNAALGTYRLLLGGALAGRVQRAVVVGHPTLSRPVTRLLARPDVDVVAVTERPDWFDVGWGVSRVIPAVDLPTQDIEWLADWQAADRAVRGDLDRLLSTDGSATSVTGPALAAAVWATLPDDGLLVVGASQPVRDLDLAAVRPDPPPVFANRGLAGIDGTVSSAWGAALASGRPVHVLLGDLTFLHDVGGLLAGDLEERPALRLVVANDRGGSIFAGLEHGAPGMAEAYERLFGTPQRVDLAALASGYGARHTMAQGLADVRQLLGSPPQGVEVVEVAVDRAGRRALEQAMIALAR